MPLYSACTGLDKEMGIYHGLDASESTKEGSQSLRVSNFVLNPGSSDDKQFLRFMSALTLPL